MPLPKPSKKELRKEFIDRCMGDDITVKDFPDNKQRYAICQDLWKEKSKAYRFNISFVNERVDIE